MIEKGAHFWVMFMTWGFSGNDSAMILDWHWDK
jgi:hypothetical protein